MSFPSGLTIAFRTEDLAVADSSMTAKCDFMDGFLADDSVAKTGSEFSPLAFNSKPPFSMQKLEKEAPPVDFRVGLLAQGRDSSVGTG